MVSAQCVYTHDSDGRARCVTFSGSGTRNRDIESKIGINGAHCTYTHATIDVTRIPCMRTPRNRTDRCTVYVHRVLDRRIRKTRRRRAQARQAWHRLTALPPPRGCERAAAGSAFARDGRRRRRRGERKASGCQSDAVISSSVKVVGADCGWRVLSGRVVDGRTA